jgi:hypothetical protein
MKAFSLSLILFAAFILSAGAQPGPGKAQASPAPGSPQATAAELAALEQFLRLSDAELAQLEQVIARIRAMKPAERAAMCNQIMAYRQMPEAQRMHLRLGWGGVPPEVQAAWRDMMHGATPERRAEIQAKMQSLPPEEKADYRRALVDEFLRQKAEKADKK